MKFARTTNMKIACDPRLRREVTVHAVARWQTYKTFGVGNNSFQDTRNAPEVTSCSCAVRQTVCHPHWAHRVCWAHAHLEVYHHQHPQELARPRSCQIFFDCLIMSNFFRLSQGNHGIKLTQWSESRLVDGVYSLFLNLLFSTSRPCLTCVTVPSTSMCHPNSTTLLTSSLAILSVRAKSCKVSWRQSWISRSKGTSPLPCQDHGHLYHKTSFARDSGYKQTLSKLPMVVLKSDPGSLGNY